MRNSGYATFWTSHDNAVSVSEGEKKAKLNFVNVIEERYLNPNAPYRNANCSCVS